MVLLGPLNTQDWAASKTVQDRRHKIRGPCSKLGYNFIGSKLVLTMLKDKLRPLPLRVPLWGPNINRDEQKLTRFPSLPSPLPRAGSQVNVDDSIMSALRFQGTVRFHHYLR